MAKALEIEDANQWKAIVEEKMESLKYIYIYVNVIKVIKGILQNYWVAFFKPKKMLKGKLYITKHN